MSTLIFPTVTGAGYPIETVPRFENMVTKKVSGFRTRVAQRAYPVWDFTLTYSGLASNSNWGYVGANTLQQIEGFFLDRQGSYDSFLLLHDTDNHVTNGAIGTGDGTTTTFILTRTMGSTLAEPVGYVHSTDISGVYLNGTPTGSYTIVAPNQLVFSSAPASGVLITASFQFYFHVTFAEDTLDFEEFMDNLYECHEVKLTSIPAYQ